MNKVHNLLGAVAVMGLMATAACSGGSEGPPPAADTTDTEAPAATDTAATEAPPADNTETTDGTMLANFTGDATAGEAVFRQCQTCHVVEAGVNRIGPSLHNIVGRHSGSIEGFNYTDANANSGITWTPEKLFQYLQDPQRIIPGTRMAFAGLPEAQDRADVIAYLQTQTD